MVAYPMTQLERAVWDIAPLARRLPEAWRTWKNDNPMGVAEIRRLQQVAGIEAFHPLGGLLLLTCRAPASGFAAGEQFVLAFSGAGAPREFLCAAAFARRSPGNTWIVGTQVLAALGAEMPRPARAPADQTWNRN